MLALIGFWSHALAACLFGAMAMWQLRRWTSDPRSRSLVAAFAVTSLWAMFVALLGPQHFLAGLAESGRNFFFLGFMYAIVRSAADPRRQGVRMVYFTVAGVIGLQIVIAGVLPRFEDQKLVEDALRTTANIIGFTISAGALVLVHNLYGQASPDSRWGIRLPAIALALLWGYDLHLYTVAYLTRGPVGDLLAMRGAVASMLVPLFALASRRNEHWKMQLSRAASFQSLSVLVILGYLILMMSATQAIALVGGNWARVGQVVLVFAMTTAALILLPSAKARAWLSVFLAKHFFEHRYDYREEWQRFTRTVALAGEDAAPVGERVVQALADIAGSPSGFLLVREEDGRLCTGSRWRWRDELPRGEGSSTELIDFLEQSAHVIDFGEHGVGAAGPCPLPAWLAGCEGAWAGIPLLHSDRLVGIVVLQHPLVRRPLDWEDFDLFRTAGMQAATYLAEARSQEALATAQRFDEFNRRFAFIIHDVKNLVSQLSLVAHNATRHADNPEFRADMIATLQSSVKKMNDLLERLGRGRGGDSAPAREIALLPLVSAVAATKRRIHPVELSGDPHLGAVADPGRLEQALVHLVQNAIDASVAGTPVRIHCERRGSEAVIEVVDSGEGMPPDFVRTRLFQPFCSTKEGGFGIGAYEARTLVAAIGGRLEVESREGVGSRFSIFLPAEPQAPSVEPELERKIA